MTKQRCGSCSTPTDYDDLTRAQDVEERMVDCRECEGLGYFGPDSGGRASSCETCGGDEDDPGTGTINTNAALHAYVQDREPMCEKCFEGAKQEYCQGRVYTISQRDGGTE